MESKEVNVIMLATEDITGLLHGNQTTRYVPGLRIEPTNGYVSQHLYFTSDDEIKEGDWLYDTALKHILQLPLVHVKCGCDGQFKKIIATTDPKLRVGGGTGLRQDSISVSIPQIPQSFIESYVKNPVDEVLLEYERATYDDWMDNGASPVPDKLKLVNNEVVVEYERGMTITKMYTKEEVEWLLMGLSSYLQVTGFNTKREREWVASKLQ